MGAKEGRPDAVRQQAANVLRKAAEIVGGEAELANRLNILQTHKITEWIARIGDAPDEVVKGAADIIFEHWSKSGK